jgi:hypothetical protein
MTFETTLYRIYEASYVYFFIKWQLFIICLEAIGNDDDAWSKVEDQQAAFSIARAR